MAIRAKSLQVGWRIVGMIAVNMVNINLAWMTDKAADDAILSLVGPIVTTVAINSRF